MNDSLGNLRTVRCNEQRFAWLQSCEHRSPRVFDGALEMQRLHADERERGVKPTPLRAWLTAGLWL